VSAILLCSSSLMAQVNIVRAEYFLDTDPGFGLGINIPIAPASNFTDSVAIPLVPISEGFHNLFLRTQDANGFWSVTNKTAFYKTSAAPGTRPNIVKVEYFIDVDPGFGFGNDIPVSPSADLIDQSFIIPLNLISEGFHNLFIRSKDANGVWSITNKVAFYKSAAATGTPPDVTKVEYFIDVDPGFGLATDIPITPSSSITDHTFSIPLNNVNEGFHNLFIRSRDANGQWSITNKVAFYKSAAATGIKPNIVKVEYFIDTDPGFGLGINLPVTSDSVITDHVVAIPIQNLTDGFHNLFLRSMDVNGQWSISNKTAFFKSSAANVNLPKIVKAEYFIDNDPGFGQAINIPVTADSMITDQVFTIPLDTVADGFHNFFIRTMNEQGRWSITNRASFYKASTSPATLPNIVRAEYFIDVDPGFGLATQIPITPSTAITNQTVIVDLVNVSIGSHKLFVRSQDSKGNWSITNVDTFYIPFISQPVVSIDSVSSPLCAGDSVFIKYSVNTSFGSTNVFTAQLSDASGNFGGAVDIGQLAATDSGVIRARIPVNTAAGSGYRIRVHASSPSHTSNPSFNAINIRRVPEVPYSISGQTSACVSTQNYSLSATEANVTYTWSISGGGTLTSNGATATVNWTTAGTDTIRVFATNACGNGQVRTLVVNVFATAPTSVPVISVSGRTLTASTGTIAQGITGYQWYRDGVALSGQTSQSYVVPTTDSASFRVAYTNPCGTGNRSAAVVVAIDKQSQTITFDAVSPKTYGDAPFTVNAVSSSGLPVTYSLLSGPGTLSGTTVTITGAGTIVVQASQAGNNVFHPATATLQVPVSKAAAGIVLTNLVHTYNGNPKAAIATTNPLGLNNLITYNGSGSVPINAGSYNVVATITSSNYEGSTVGTLIINKANQTINLQSIPDKSFNSAPFTVTAVASSGLPVALAISTSPSSGVASINGNVITLLGGGGTVTVTATQVGNINYNPAANATTTFNVTPPLANDIQVVSILSPEGGCSLGNQASVSIRLKNLGTAAASNFSVSYAINDGTAITDSVSSLAAGAQLDYTFSVAGGFSTQNKNYRITAWSSLTGDQRTSNDTISKNVFRPAPISASLTPDTAICLGNSITLRATGGGVYAWAGGPSTATYTVSPTVTTTYQVTITDAFGCSTVNRSVTVTVNQNPIANAGNDTSMLRGSSVTLTASGGIKYLWNTGDTTASVSVSPQNTTNYVVTVGNAAKCKSTDTVKVTVNFSALNVSPGITDFGSVVLDSSKTQTIRIINTGTLPENISALTGMTAPFTTTVTAPRSIAPGDTLLIAVKFLPTAQLFYQNNLTITTSVGNFNISLKGRGVAAAPAWTITPTTHNYGSVQTGTFADKAFIITNTGNVTARITTMSSSSPRFVPSLIGSTTIPVGGSVTVNIRFNPLAITSYAGSITIRTSTAGLGILKPIVSGSGFVNGAPPQIVYVSNPPFNDTSGVTPPVGVAGDFTYSIIYKHPSGVAPMSGFPKVGIDKNADGDFADAGEGIYSMAKMDTGRNWIQGVKYSLVQTLPIGDFYGYQFFATDSLGNSTTINNYKRGPLVTRQTLDLQIFASDITFSTSTPAVNQDFQVSATVRNPSPYPAADVEVKFYYKDSLYLFTDTIVFIDGFSSATLTHTLNFSPDGFYPIKVWIDSSRQLGENNILNNYATRPVIVGNFTVPGAIDITSSAAPDGCTKGKIIFSGHANYRGLNLQGTPPVEGARVTIKVFNYGPTPRTIITQTNTNGDWYVYDDPCREDAIPEDCDGYLCGVTYNYTVEVTDFTLTSPTASGSVTRPCVNCNPSGQITHTSGVGCVLPGNPFVYELAIANYSFDFLNRKLCAPTVYNDTISIFLDGELKYTYTRDSIKTCTDVSLNSAFAGLPIGSYNLSYTHSYYTAAGERREFSEGNTLKIEGPKVDLRLEGVTKTGHKSFEFADINITGCGALPAGPHMIYLYDSLVGYTERVLIDSFAVSTLNGGIGLSYNNPNWALGIHHITLITDVKGEVAELNENNNILRTTFYVEEPDLTAKGIKFSTSSVTAGSLINFSAKIKNVGADVATPFQVAFRANGSIVGTNTSIPSLQTNQEVEVVSAPFTIPANHCPIQIVAYADVNNQITEFKETNNNDTAKFGINIRAGRSCSDDTGEETVGAGFFNPDDVTGTFQCIPYIAPKGRLTHFATTVKNTGSRDASNIKVRFSLNGVTIGNDVIPILKAGQRVESGFFYTFDTVGRFIISAFADHPKEICEINEGDNIGLIHVDTRPTSADLQILSQHIVPSNLNPHPGQSITIASSILNVGTAPSKRTKVRFWVNNVQLGSDVLIDSIYPGLDTTVLATVPYSSNVVGLKVIKVKADLEDVVLERNELNNEATRGIIVGAAPDFSRSKNEAITLIPSTFNQGDSITIRNYLRNYGGENGSAWLRFSVRYSNGVYQIIDSVQFSLASNDSARVSLRWKVGNLPGVLITEVIRATPPEFDVLNNIDSLPFVPGNPVPLTLVSFAGAKQNYNSVITWRTAAEYDLDRFELERSTDGQSFNRIFSKSATNASGYTNYRFDDNDVWRSNDQLFYRLKIIEKSGGYKLSPVIRLSSTRQMLVNVSPNPLQNILNASIQTITKGTHVIRILDAAGKQYQASSHELAAGSHLLTFDVSRLAKGLYILVVQQPSGTSEMVKFVKE
jgi:subtilase family serine protease